MRPSDYLGEGAWNLPRRLDQLSTLMWRCGPDPMLRPTLVVLALLDRPPDPARFAAGHEWATRMVPRLRERPVAPPLTPTLPIWTQDPDFDLSRHWHRTALPRPAGRRELLDLAEHLAATPFAPDRPPWESVLVENLSWDGYHAAWLLRFHHCLADGRLVAFWLGSLLNRSRDPRVDKPQPPVPPRPLDPLATQLLGPLRTPSVPHAIRSPLANIHSLTRLTTITRPSGTPSPLLRSRGTARRFELVPVDLDRLRSSARHLNVSVNAAYCAGLLAGIRRYHTEHHVTAPSLSTAITMPADTTRRTGNHFNGGKFAAPLINDPRTLSQAIDPILSHPPFPPPLLDAILASVNMLPSAALLRLARTLGRSIDLQISHVAAPGRDAYVSGARVEQMWCFGPAPGCAVMALMVSRGRLGALALTLDSAAVPDPTAFRRCITDGFADVTKTCSPPRTPPPPRPPPRSAIPHPGASGC